MDDLYIEDVQFLTVRGSLSRTVAPNKLITSRIEVVLQTETDQENLFTTLGAGPLPIRFPDNVTFDQGVTEASSVDGVAYPKTVQLTITQIG